MLIKVTNYCDETCSHCMESSTVRGAHMPEETFFKALALTRRLETKAWLSGCPPLVLLSGGECTSHPDILRFIERVMAEGMFPLLLTNGMWLGNKEMREAILRPEWPNLFIQVTNDPRYYKVGLPERVVDKRIRYIEALTLLLPLGRAARRPGEATDVPTKSAPSSFNIRSATRALGSLEDALVMHRQRAMLGKNGNCSPSISSDGKVVAGESNACWTIGTVDSTHEELTKALIEMRCNRCGLVDNLTPEQKRAIGESVLFGPSE